MVERKLDRRETDFMREYIQEGVARNETDEQIKERRRELAQLFDCTLPQVVGAVAWKKHEEVGTLILEPLELPQDNPSDIPIPTAEETANKPEALPAPEKDESEIVAKTYESMDYDYETKRKWRSILQKCIQEDLPLVDPAHTRVLFFPGRHCHEAVIYQQLGIPTANLVGFIKDKDPHAIEDFQRSVQKYGIDGRVGDLEEACDADIGRFTIVSLDFPGELCDKYHRICGEIPLQDRSIVMVNTMGKREKGRSHVLLGMADRSINGNTFMENLEKIGVCPYSTREERDRKRNGFRAITEEKAEDVQHSRSQHAHILTVGSMGCMQTRNWMFRDEILNSEAMQRRDRSKCKESIRYLRSCASVLGPLIGKNLANALSDYSWDKTQAERMASLASGGLFLDAVFCRPHMLSLKKYQYTSEGSSKSPYNTDIAVLDIPRNDYNRLSRTAHFLLQCFLSELIRSWEIRWFETRFLVRTRNCSELGIGGKLARNDKLVFSADGKTVCDIPIKHLFEDAEFHGDLVSRYPLESRKTQAEIPRQKIE